MKKILLFLFIGFLITTAIAQTEASSKPKSFNIQKEIKPPFLEIVEGSIVFEDANHNNMIDADESCKIKLAVKNSGKGDGNGLTYSITAKGATQGVTFKNNQPVNSIKVGETQTITIPITANMNTVDGSVDFTIKINEPYGFGTDEIVLNLRTKAFEAPMIKIVDYTVTSTSPSGLLEKKRPFNLQVLLQNTNYGVGENVTVKIALPAGVTVLTSNESVQVGTLTSGKKTDIVYELIVSDNFTGENILIDFKISEKYGKYAENKTLKLQLKQQLAAGMIKFDAKEELREEISIGSLTSDVDNNIPVNPVKHPNRYAIVIGNEDYTSFQRGLNKEANVPFAVADATSFKNYCLNVLGVTQDNAFLLTNATTGQMTREIDRVLKIISKNSGDAELIFYYAGHGYPDKDNEPYIMPVDVTAQDLKNGIKLNDLYDRFSKLDIARVTLFLDACFSGGGRDAGLLAARAVRITPVEGTLDGNLVVFAATESDQRALPYPEKQHGMFTYFLLKKLQETNGNISYEELSNYLRKNVSLYSLRINNAEQDPIVKFSAKLNKEWGSFNFKPNR